ncbi:MAG: hypothetical protein Ct9H300mP13_8580 [Gammaproteobacteria bacterium]|nr:MAG: hypothetical protein Ct9H300mP13_8580 [Gammaproteobacteria bacterium]
MIAKADIFAENFAPGAIERSGFRTKKFLRSIHASSTRRSKALAKVVPLKITSRSNDRSGCRWSHVDHWEADGRPLKPG